MFSSNYVKQELKDGILDPDKVIPAYYKTDPNKNVFENAVNVADLYTKILLKKINLDYRNYLSTML